MALSLQGCLELILSNPANRALLERLPVLGLPQCYLTGGCLFQAVWNSRLGWEADRHVRDYDVSYFDPTDLSWEAEDRAIRQVNEATVDLGVRVELSNQARVHVWYEQKFGTPGIVLGSSKEAISRFLMPCCCLGIEVATGALFAPFGLADTWEGILRPNPSNLQPERFRAKAADYQLRWLFLQMAE